VQLSPDATTTDVAELLAAISSADAASTDPGRAQHLMAAADLYRGPLLPGYYEDWVLPEQMRLADLYFPAAQWLVEHFARQGDWDRALDYARRALSADPLREDMHQHLMGLLAAGGKRAAALRQYRELERLLKAQWDAVPSSGTRELAEEIERLGDDERLQAVTPRGLRAGNVPSDHPAPRLPAGTGTFLLATVETSKNVRERDRQSAEQAARAYYNVLRQECSSKGHELSAQHGALTLAFSRPSEALACAISCQQGAAEQTQPRTVEACVRIALDTTEAQPSDDDSPGSLLRRGRELLFAAHGGQIMCSDATADLLRRNLPEGVGLSDCGLYYLRYLQQPERIFCIEYPGAPPDAVSPPNARRAYASNLPLQLTAFFGREDELAHLEEMILDKRARLVTLIGPGGSGKTRLAIEVARHLIEAFRDAVWFVDLQALSSPSLIVLAVRDALELPHAADANAMEQVKAALSRQPSLLILDNFEQFVQGGAEIVEALLSCTDLLTCLITSRECLRLHGEHELSLHPLPTPIEDQDLESLAQCPSVELFVDRAQAVRPDFQVTDGNAQSVAALCSRLDGIPLALELIASRAQILSPKQMVDRLEHRLDFPVSRERGVSDRHRTLRAAFDWSCQLLRPPLQRFFSRLSVFRGGWTPEAATEVCQETSALECLEELRQCSLVTTEQNGPRDDERRLDMLETVREYASDQLPGGEREGLARRHARHYLRLAEQAEPHLRGADQSQWLERLTLEHDNLRAALVWAESADKEANTALRLAGALWRFWDVRGLLVEGRLHLETALTCADASSPTPAHGKAMSGAGKLAREQGDYEAALALFEKSLAIWRHLGDKRGIAAALSGLARTTQHLGDHAGEEALVREDRRSRRASGHTHGIASAADNLGIVAEAQGDYTAARGLFEESLAIDKALGNQAGIAASLAHLGSVATAQGDYAAARALLDESLGIHRQLGDQRSIAAVLHLLGDVADAEGDRDRALRLHEESLAIRRRVGDRPGTARSLLALGVHARRRRRYAQAHECFQESLPITQETGNRRDIATCLEGIAGLCVSQKKHEMAARIFGAADQLRETIGAPIPVGHRHRHDREIASIDRALDAGGFERAWAQGRAMDLDEAIAEALRASGRP